MFKKIFDTKKSIVPVAIHEDRFEITAEAEINATQTPVAWGEKTEYLFFGKVREIPSTTLNVYGE